MFNVTVSIPRFRQFLSTSLYRNAFYLILSGTGVSFFGFIFWIVAARLYSEETVGLSSAIISAVNLMALLGSIGLNFTMIRYLSSAERPQQFINASLVLSILASLAVAGVFLAGTSLWSPALDLLKSNVLFCLGFLAIVVFSTSSNLISSVFIARLTAGFVLSKEMIFSTIRIPLLAILVTLLGASGIVASWGIAIGIAAIVPLIFFIPRVEKDYRPALTLNISGIKGIGWFSFSNYLVILLARAAVMVLPIMVVNLLGTESNAYFYVAWALASILFEVNISTSQAVFAEGSSSAEEIKNNIPRAIKLNLFILVPAVLVMMAAGKWLLLAFGSAYSANSLWLLWLLAFSSIPRGINHIYFGVLRAQDRLKELLAFRAFITVSVLVLSFLLLPAYGIISVGYVWLAVQVVVCIVSAPKLAASAR